MWRSTTIPMVAAVNQVSSVKYAEIVASVSSGQQGGNRANIDSLLRHSPWPQVGGG